MIRHVCKEAFFLFQLPLNKNFSHGDLPYCQSYYKSDISDDKKSLGLSFPADVLASFGLHHPACLYQAASCPGPVVLVLFPSPRQVIVTTSTAVAFGMADAVAPAKVCKEFIEKAKKGSIKCGMVDGQLLDVKGVEALASIPSREVLLAKIMGSMMSAVSKFVYVVEALRKKQAGEEA